MFIIKYVQRLIYEYSCRLLRETCFDLIGILSVEYTFGPATALLYRKSALGTCSNVAIATAKLAEVLSREIVF